jgi:hypothetical protein
MLQSLDTLIAFVVILLSASLLVTILVQMLSSAFALRGKNLGNALALTFQSIHPDIGANAYALAERILSDPRLSDSTMTIKTVGEHTTPDQKTPWSWWSLFNGLHLAKDIRPGEIYDLLKKISAAAPAQPIAASAPLDAATPVSPSPAGSAKVEPGSLADQKPENPPPRPAAPTEADLGTLAKQIIEKVGVPHTDVVKVEEAFSGLLNVAGKLGGPEEKESLSKAINAAQTSFKAVAVHVTADVDKLTKWFTAAEDRAQQWFQMHTRIFTIICGILLAFLFQLDSVEIFKFVSTNATARAALVGSADKLIEKADGILKNNGSIIDAIYKAEAVKFPGLTLTPEALKSATNTSLLRDEIKKALGSPEPKDFNTNYDTVEKSAIDAWYKERSDQLSTLTKDVAATGFDLLPKSLGHRWDSKGTYSGFCAHFLGMAITAGLLSLGAPYWYNLLKNLTSLRPAVSQLIGEEKAAKRETKK